MQYLTAIVYHRISSGYLKTLCHTLVRLLWNLKMLLYMIWELSLETTPLQLCLSILLMCHLMFCVLYLN